MFVNGGIGERKAIQPYSLQSDYWDDGHKLPDCPKGKHEEI